MRLFSYVVSRDYGFAPNPFFGFCTLATCKPNIRKAAAIGDWVVGTGSKQVGRRGFLVYMMRISETLTFDDYWTDPRFQRKKPNLRGSLKHAYGDNIYFLDGNDQWQQLNSHHSNWDGAPNPHNIQNDTKVDRVLISTEYAYWGGDGPQIDKNFFDYDGQNVCAVRNHKSNFSSSLVDDFIEWFNFLDNSGYLGVPLKWQKTL